MGKGLFWLAIICMLIILAVIAFNSGWFPAHVNPSLK